MTRKEAIKHITTWMYATTDLPPVQVAKAFDMVFAALRPISREQVEKVWRGEWKRTHSSDNFWTGVWVCSRCGLEDDNGDCFDFCPSCGAPMTDEAVEILMKRLEKMHETM